MSRVLPDTPPYVTGQVRPALAPAAAWIDTHAEALRGVRV